MAESMGASSRPPATPWFPFLAGPIVGVLHLAIGYLLVARSCATGFPGFTAGGLSGLQLVELALGIVAEVVLIAAILKGLQVWRTSADRAEAGAARAPNPGPTTLARVRFMTLVGVVMSIGFGLYVLYATAAAMILNPCVFL